MSSKSKSAPNSTPKTGKAAEKRPIEETTSETKPIIETEDGTTTTTTTPAKRAKDAGSAKAAFLASLEREGVAPTRTLRNSSGSTPMATCEGIITSTNMITVPGKNGPVPKLEITAVTRHVRSQGVPDCIDSGIPGMAFLLPTNRPSSDADKAGGDAADDGPEAAVANKGKGGGTGDKKKEAIPRTLHLTEGHKTVWLGFIKTSIYTTSPSSDDDKSKSKVDLDLIKVGQVVEISGNVANLGADGKTLWLNSARVTPLREDFSSIDQTKKLITEFMTPETACTSTFLASMCVQSYFGHDFGIDDARSEQAQVLHRMWAAFPQQLSKACENMATTMRAASADNESNAKILDSHSNRLSQISPADLASGASMVFIPTMMPTQERPQFSAPLVQFGKTPAVPQPSIVIDFVTFSNLDKIPRTFVALDIREGQVEHQGAAINLKAGLHIVADKEAAIKKLEDCKNPVLSTGKFASVGIRLNMRTACGLYFGTIAKAKAEMAANEILPYADMAGVFKMCPKDMNSDGLQCCFPDAISIDMPASIPKVGLPVGEKWVQTHMCGGATQFVFEADPDVPKIKEKDQRTDVSVNMPVLKSHGFQAISESGFKFAQSKSPLDKPFKKYFVVFQGCSQVMAMSEFAEGDEEAGQQAVEEEAKEKELELTEFLTSRSIVYCVAFEAKEESGSSSGSSDA